MNVLVLGATGMLGNTVFRVLAETNGIQVFGSVRQIEAQHFFTTELASQLVVVENLEKYDQLERLLDAVQPQVVVNCISLEKSASQDLEKSLSIFSLLPQRLGHLCRLRDARLIQISSDGVFSGSRGKYTEDDCPDASDVYGIAKLLGEVKEPHAITLRTSIIGHELQTKTGLLEWFLAQNNQCLCYRRTIFSGFPTVVLARLIRDVVLPRPDLYGVYHVASQPISKFDLLQMVAQKYAKAIELVPDDRIVIDRSLSAERFAKVTGYVPPAWPELIDSMYSYKYGLEKK